MGDTHANPTWAVLLGRWVEFAKASVGLPKGAEGDRWREATSSIISLQAVTFAVKEIDSIDADAERAVGFDKAEVLIQQEAGRLHELWKGEPLHEELVALIDDARTALTRERDGGIEWRVTSERLVAGDPSGLLVALMEGGFDGDVLLPVGGGELFEGAPAAFARGALGRTPERWVLEAVKAFLCEGGEVRTGMRVKGPRQVYRQYDFGAGRAVRDVVMGIEDGLPAGQPLLVWAMEGGEMGQLVRMPPGTERIRGGLPVEDACDV